MNAQDCLQMLREIRDVSFATVDADGFPHNRIIDVMLVEKDRLVFCTARGKDFYRQLTANPHVAISGLNRKWQMIRLQWHGPEAGRPGVLAGPDFHGKPVHE
jgi:uncharacterized pyridoxamine 5'-phosphate oxidase family protein